MLGVIIKKELRRVFTDRRLVFSTFVIPALSIYILYTIMGNMAGNLVDDIKGHTSTVYVSDAPESFQAYVERVKQETNMDIHFGDFQKSDYEEKIRTGEVDLLVTFEEGFDEKITSYLDSQTPPEVKTFYNPVEEYSGAARSEFVYNLLEKYRAGILTERFGNLTYSQAFAVDSTNAGESEILDEKKAGTSVLSMIMPMLLSILLFAGAMGIGMDTIAGEKERGTMATLLLTPVKRETIALGKVIGLGVVSIISAITSFVAIIASLPNMMSSVSGGESPEMGISFSVMQYLELFAVMILLVGIFVGLICLISVRARTVKEAGTLVAPVYMVIMGISMTTMFTKGGEAALYKFAIPVYGSIMAIKEMFEFELSMNEFAVSSIIAMVTTVILIKLITITFNDEKVMLNA